MDGLARPIALHLPKRIEIGAGAAARLGAWAKPYRRPLVIAQRSTAGMADRLGLGGAFRVFAPVAPEPKYTDLAAAIEAAREHRPDLVVGLGGGSAMNVAKLVAALWDGDQGIVDVAGPNRVEGRHTALAQVATTAGTGSEAGIRALVTSSETGMKVAVESPHMLADIAVLDPDLTMSLPPAVTAATGVDALAHCVEAFTSRKAHPLIDGYARMGMDLVGRYLRRAVEDGADAVARAGMLLAAFYGGLCLGPVNTAADHAVAYPLGTRAGLAHGLPAAPDPDSVLSSARGFCQSAGIEMSLKAAGIDLNDLRPWAEEAHGIRRLMDNNPRVMSVDDVEAIYRAAL